MNSVVNAWYGTEVPCRILSRMEEIEEFEFQHDEVPPTLWQYVDHTRRIFNTWLRVSPCIDILVLDGQGHPELIQEAVFKDAFESASAWHDAVHAVLKSGRPYWIAFHDDD